MFLEIAKLLGRDVSSFARALPFDLSENELQNLRSQSRDNLEEATLKVISITNNIGSLFGCFKTKHKQLQNIIGTKNFVKCPISFRY